MKLSRRIIHRASVGNLGHLLSATCFIIDDSRKKRMKELSHEKYYTGSSVGVKRSRLDEIIINRKPRIWALAAIEFTSAEIAQSSAIADKQNIS